MNSVKKYRKKPVVIEAMQWTGDNRAEIVKWAGDKFDVLDEEYRDEDPEATAQVFDELHSTWVLVYDGDWIIKGVKGEFYPCNREVFEGTYEPVEDSVPVAGWSHGRGEAT